MTAAVHLREAGPTGTRPACHIDRRWNSCVITTTSTPERVTCQRPGCRP